MPDTPRSLFERLRQPGASQADWDRLVAIYAPFLRGMLLCHSLQGADVDDLVQDVLAVLVRKLGQFRHNGKGGAFRTWLRAIVANEVRAFYRRRRNRPEPADPQDEASPLLLLEQADSELSRRWDEEHDRHVMVRLLEIIRPEFTPPTWQAFERSALQGRPAAEVAAELGLTANAVCIARSRVLRRLRQEARDLLQD
jgi:RNA polymerase sigma-70 factor (ECF subfamily)